MESFILLVLLTKFKIYQLRIIAQHIIILSRSPHSFGNCSHIPVWFWTKCFDALALFSELYYYKSLKKLPGDFFKLDNGGTGVCNWPMQGFSIPNQFSTFRVCPLFLRHSAPKAHTPACFIMAVERQPTNNLPVICVRWMITALRHLTVSPLNTSHDPALTHVTAMCEETGPIISALTFHRHINSAFMLLAEARSVGRPFSQHRTVWTRGS